MFLRDQAYWRKMRFFTFDVQDRRLNDRFKHDNCFTQGDIMRDPKIIAKIRAILKGNATFLYCDNGNKPTELRLYAPHVRPGSVVGVHDYPKEINWEAVKEAGMLDWEKLLFEEASALKTMQLFFLK
jgi:hypothetical protein